jgi:hypothetical protein
MARGDAQRTWFPEMIAMLRGEWQPPISCVALIELRDRLDATLQAIRSERNIFSPIMKCPKCHREARMARPKVSVRALILALTRFGIVPQGELKGLEKMWTRYREQNQLDLNGKQQRPAAGNCATLHESGN